VEQAYELLARRTRDLKMDRDGPSAIVYVNVLGNVAAIDLLVQHILCWLIRFIDLKCFRRSAYCASHHELEGGRFHPMDENEQWRNNHQRCG